MSRGPPTNYGNINNNFSLISSTGTALLLNPQYYNNQPQPVKSKIKQKKKSDDYGNQFKMAKHSTFTKRGDYDNYSTNLVSPQIAKINFSNTGCAVAASELSFRRINETEQLRSTRQHARTSKTSSRIKPITHSRINRRQMLNASQGSKMSPGPRILTTQAGFERSLEESRNQAG